MSIEITVVNTDCSREGQHEGNMISEGSGHTQDATQECDRVGEDVVAVIECERLETGRVVTSTQEKQDQLDHCNKTENNSIVWFQSDLGRS